MWLLCVSLVRSEIRSVICCIRWFRSSSWDFFGGYLILFGSLFASSWKLWKLGFDVVLWVSCSESRSVTCCIRLIRSTVVAELAQFEFSPHRTGSNDARATVMDDAQKTALVQAEVQRMKCLPPSSAYVIHRLKVLNKMLQLLSKVSISRIPILCINHSFNWG